MGGWTSLLCIRPVDRRAGRGLDGNTHAPLASLADKLTGSHLGHQARGALISPFHAGSIANSGRGVREPAPPWCVSKARPWHSTLQLMRASLLARAVASLFLCRRGA